MRSCVTGIPTHRPHDLPHFHCIGGRDFPERYCEMIRGDPGMPLKHRPHPHQQLGLVFGVWQWRSTIERGRRRLFTSNVSGPSWIGQEDDPNKTPRNLHHCCVYIRDFLGNFCLVLIWDAVFFDQSCIEWHYSGSCRFRLATMRSAQIWLARSVCGRIGACQSMSSLYPVSVEHPRDCTDNHQRFSRKTFEHRQAPVESRSFPVVFRLSRSLWDSLASASGYTRLIGTLSCPLVNILNTLPVIDISSSRVLI